MKFYVGMFKLLFNFELKTKSLNFCSVLVSQRFIEEINLHFEDLGDYKTAISMYFKCLEIGVQNLSMVFSSNNIGRFESFLKILTW